MSMCQDVVTQMKIDETHSHSATWTYRLMFVARTSGYRACVSDMLLYRMKIDEIHRHSATWTYTLMLAPDNEWIYSMYR
jgi:hypothetical protein